MPEALARTLGERLDEIWLWCEKRTALAHHVDDLSTVGKRTNNPGSAFIAQHRLGESVASEVPNNFLRIFKPNAGVKQFWSGSRIRRAFAFGNTT